MNYIEQFLKDNGIEVNEEFYVKTKELAQKAIDEVTEERLKKYVFNVKE